jgi:hypothetical protein
VLDGASNYVSVKSYQEVQFKALARHLACATGITSMAALV